MLKKFFYDFIYIFSLLPVGMKVILSHMADLIYSTRPRECDLAVFFCFYTMISQYIGD